jgi:hypothetical protein
MPELTFQMTQDEVGILNRPVNSSGGFQAFFRRLQQRLDPATTTIELSDAEMGRIVRHISYKPGGFEGRLSDIFGRSLRDLIE